MWSPEHEPKMAYQPEMSAPPYIEPPRSLPPNDPWWKPKEFHSRGRCACGQGFVQPHITICGIVSALLCFPCGLYCLFYCTDEFCDFCRARIK
jgi:hypothetical protein